MVPTHCGATLRPDSGKPLVRLPAAGCPVPSDRRQRMRESAVRTKEAAS